MYLRNVSLKFNLVDMSRKNVILSRLLCTIVVYYYCYYCFTLICALKNVIDVETLKKITNKAIRGRRQQLLSVKNVSFEHLLNAIRN